MANTSATAVASGLEQIAALNGSFSLYMAHGGTNFGFYSGVKVGPRWACAKGRPSLSLARSILKLLSSARPQHGRRFAPPRMQRTEGEVADWPDDYTPDGGPNSTKWPAGFSRADIEAEASRSVQRYVEDWGWELHKYARLKNSARFHKTLRYQIHLEGARGFGKQKEVLDWQDTEFKQCSMYWTAFHGFADWTKELLDLGASANLADVDNWTPIAIAAYAGHEDVVQVLLAAGARTDLRVSDGDTAYDKAVAWDHPAIAALLASKPR